MVLVAVVVQTLQAELAVLELQDKATQVALGTTTLMETYVQVAVAVEQLVLVQTARAELQALEDLVALLVFQVALLLMQQAEMEAKTVLVAGQLQQQILVMVEVLMETLLLNSKQLAQVS